MAAPLHGNLYSTGEVRKGRADTDDSLKLGRQAIQGPSSVSATFLASHLFPLYTGPPKSGVILGEKQWKAGPEAFARAAFRQAAPQHLLEVLCAVA